MRRSHVDKSILARVRFIRNRKQEHVVCLSLDSTGHIIACRVVTIGLLDKALAHPREIFAGAIIDRAASVIVAHNHPSGIAEPSRMDMNMTNQLVAAGQLLGIPLHDHLIVTRTDYYSYRINRLL